MKTYNISIASNSLRPKWICSSHLKLAIFAFIRRVTKILLTHAADRFESIFLFFSVGMKRVYFKCKMFGVRNWTIQGKLEIVSLSSLEMRQQQHQHSRTYQIKGILLCYSACCNIILKQHFQPNRRNYNHLKFKHQKQHFFLIAVSVPFQLAFTIIKYFFFAVHIRVCLLC